MEVRDPVHGSIKILDEETSILRHEFFQRLRNIKQLGFSDLVFPGATHTRFLHSIGVMDVGNRAFDSLFRHHSLEDKTILRLKETFKLGCLLHDIGHAPLSHSTEVVMPQLAKLEIPQEFLKDGEDLERKATHEDYTVKAIVDSSFTQSFKDVTHKFGVEPNRVADLILGHTKCPEYFTFKGIDYFPLLSQLVSSELDCDRMDYLLRDGHFCGVSYGSYDLDWLLDNIEPCIIEGQAHLGLTERAVVTFDDFLLSRYHMFLMVYFHYKSVCMEQLLLKYFRSSPDEYRIPSNIEEYIEHDDHFLMKVMRKSKNPYAQAIIKNKIPKKIFESFNEDQHETLYQIETYLIDQKIEYIKGSSRGRLSKYYTQERSPIESFSVKVVRQNCLGDEKTYFNINEATDLYLRYSKSHEVNRLHCEWEQLSSIQKKHIEELALAKF